MSTEPPSGGSFSPLTLATAEHCAEQIEQAAAAQEQTNRAELTASVGGAGGEGTGPERAPPQLGVPGRSADTVNPFTSAYSAGSQQLRARLRALNLLMAGAMTTLALLAVVRLVRATPEKPTTAGVALPVQLACLVSFGLTAGLLTWVRRPGQRLLTAAQWLTIVTVALFACYFFVEKLFDDVNGSMTLFLVHHPAFAAVAYGFAAYGFAITYGALIPNTWRACAAQTGVLVGAPLVLTVGISVALPKFAPLLIGPFLYVLTAVMGFCYAVVVYSAYTVSKLKEDVIQARRVGQYRLLEKLGEGGMGVVYRAEHRLLKRPCAVKLIRPRHADTPTALTRFEREVRAMAGLSHWNAVDVYDYGVTDQGLFYYVMELLQGLSARQVVDRFGPLPPARVVYLLRQVCAALNEAHARGLVHRDVTPANVFVAEVGGQFDVVKLLDFGLVHDATRQLDGDTLTQEGVVMGTPGYMSYEQATGARYLDCRSDLYSVGAVGFFLLTGERPFAGNSNLQVLAAQLKGDFLPVRRLCPACPGPLADILERCLQCHPADRYTSTAELDAALAEALPAGEGWTAADAAVWWKERRVG